MKGYLLFSVKQLEFNRSLLDSLNYKPQQHILTLPRRNNIHYIDARDSIPNEYHWDQPIKILHELGMTKLGRDVNDRRIVQLPNNWQIDLTTDDRPQMTISRPDGAELVCLYIIDGTPIADVITPIVFQILSEDELAQYSSTYDPNNTVRMRVYLRDNLAESLYTSHSYPIVKHKDRNKPITPEQFVALRNQALTKARKECTAYLRDDGLL